MRAPMIGLLVLAVLSAAVLGCSDDEGSDSAEQLYGTWDLVDVGVQHTFASVGSFDVVDSYSLSGGPLDTGTSTFDGSIVTLDTDEGTGACSQTTGSSEVTFSGPDTMSLELIDDECRHRGADVPGVRWVRVEED